MLLSLFANKYVIIGIVLAVVIGGGAIYINALKSKNEVLTEKNNTLTALLEVSQASVKSLQAAIDEQNAAVQKLKSDSEAREKAGIAAVAKAKAEAAVSKKKAETIITAKIPEGKSVCEAANDLFDQEIKK